MGKVGNYLLSNCCSNFCDSWCSINYKEYIENAVEFITRTNAFTYWHRKWYWDSSLNFVNNINYLFLHSTQSKGAVQVIFGGEKGILSTKGLVGNLKKLYDFCIPNWLRNHNCLL
jgi:hypothetical protein